MYELNKQITQKKEIKKKQLETVELSEVKDSPSINASSRQINRSVEAILHWEKEKQKKKKTLEEKLKLLEQMNIRPPKINPISAKLAQTMDRGEKVEDFLLHKAVQSKQKKEELIKHQLQKQQRQQMCRTPQIQQMTHQQ